MIRWWLLFACGCKVADATWQTGLPKVAVLWCLVAAALILRERVGYVAVTVAAFGTALAGVENASHHVVVLGWVAAAMQLAEREAALRALTITIYAFAAVNKLAFGFLTGEIIREHAHVPLPPVVWPLAVAAVVLEGWLAWAVWTRNRWAVPVAVALHAGIVVWSGATTPVNVGIAVMFNGLLVLLVRESLHSPDVGHGPPEGELPDVVRQGPAAVLHGAHL